MRIDSQDLTLLVVTFASTLAGIFFPGFGSWFSPLPFYLLMVLLLLSFLTIPLRAIGSEMKNSAGVIGGLVCCKLILLPIAMFFLFRWLLPSYALAALLLTGISTAAVAPFFAGLLPANGPVVVATLVISSLLAPVTLPALVKILAGGTLRISFMAMAQMLCLMVFVPFIVSEILKRWAGRVVSVLLPRRYPLAMLFFAVMNLGVYSRYPDYFRKDVAGLGVALAVAIALSGTSVAAGFVFGCRLGLGEQLAAILSLGLLNNMMVLMFSSRFFGPHEFTVAAAYTVPFFGLILPLRSYGERRGARDAARAKAAAASCHERVSG